MEICLYKGKLNFNYFKTHKNIVWIIALNIIATISQVIVFKLINVELGKDALGIWALLVTANIVGQISNLNFSNSLIRYIPEYLISDKKKEIERMAGTINMANLIVSIPLLLLFYFSSLFYAKQLLNFDQYTIFTNAVPWIFAGVFFNNFFLIFSCLLDGFQKFYIRCAIQITGWIIFLFSSIFLLKSHGLEGIALAIFIQAICQLLIAASIIKSQTKLSNAFPLFLNIKHFRTISSFGLKIQTVGMLSAFMDPLIKFFITNKLGLSGVANFEIANRAASQLRGLLINTNQVIVPKVVYQKSKGKFDSFFINSINTNVYYSVMISTITLLISPLLIWFINGKIENNLISYIVIMNMGGAFNLATSIHYFCCIGLDKIKNLVYLHFIYGSVIMLFYTIGNNFHMNETTLICIPSFSLIVASLYNAYVFTRKKGAFLWIKSLYFLLFLGFSFLLFLLKYNQPYYYYTVTVLMIFTFAYLMYKRKKVFFPETTYLK